MLAQVAVVLTIVSCGVWVVVSARKRSWAELTIAVCVMLASVLQAIKFRGSEWVHLAVAVVAIASAILLLRQRLRDPERRSSWTR